MIDPTLTNNNCLVCGGEVPPIPNNLYQVSNQTKSSVLFIQMAKSGMGKNNEVEFEPTPVCIPCVVKILSNLMAPQEPKEPEIIDVSENDKKEIQN
jgi:hypothetical protein